MSAGRLQLFDTRASLRDRTSRLLLRLTDGRELRLREFGTKQRAWVKLLTDEVAAEETLADARARGLARSAAAAAAAGCATPAVRAAARPARDRWDRALVGRRDPARREALAVQARLRPRQTRRPSGYVTRSSPGSGERSPTTSSRSSCRSRTSCRCRCGPSPQRRAVPALWERDRGGLLRGLRDVLLPDLPDRRQGAQGPAPVAAVEVTGAGTLPMAFDPFERHRQRTDGSPQRYRENSGAWRFSAQSPTSRAL